MKNFFLLLFFPFISFSQSTDNFSEENLSESENFNNFFGLNIGYSIGAGSDFTNGSSIKYVPFGVFWQKQLDKFNIGSTIDLNFPMRFNYENQRNVIPSLEAFITKDILSDLIASDNNKLFVGGSLGFSQWHWGSNQDILLSIGLLVGSKKISYVNEKYGFDIKAKILYKTTMHTKNKYYNISKYGLGFYFTPFLRF